MVQITQTPKRQIYRSKKVVLKGHCYFCLISVWPRQTANSRPRAATSGLIPTYELPPTYEMLPTYGM